MNELLEQIILSIMDINPGIALTLSLIHSVLSETHWRLQNDPSCVARETRDQSMNWF